MMSELYAGQSDRYVATLGDFYLTNQNTIEEEQAVLLKQML